MADWVLAKANSRTGAEFEMLDLVDYDLPLLDAPLPPSLGNYTQEHTKAWAAAVSRFDGVIFVTAEYNHSVPGALKKRAGFPLRGMEQQGRWIRLVRKRRRCSRRRKPCA